METIEFLADVKYNQQVKTKTKQSVVDIVGADDFFDLVYQNNILPKLEEESQLLIENNLKMFLSLDQNYLDLLLIKKIIKACTEIEESEELKQRALEY